MSAAATEAGRLAPSPTGGLHPGHARTFLAAWLLARADGGRVVLRIEDLDSGRARPGMADQAIADLRWLGLNWDEGPDVGGPSGPYVQSERSAVFESALARLIAAEQVYPCTCTRADVARAAGAPHAEDEGPTYPGTCSGRSPADADTLRDAGRHFAWRFCTAGSGPVAWDDLARGPTVGDPALQGGDFVVARSNGSFGYQLAVVVDDAAMGVTQVVRGDDLLASTPRQILVYRALGLAPPQFGHLPLVVGPDGRRLTKREDSIKLATLRSSGVDPRRLVGLLAWSLGLSDRVIPTFPADWVGELDLAGVPRGPWRFEPAGPIAD